MHLNIYRASIVSFKTSIHSAVSSFSSGFVPPNFLTSDQIAAIVEDLTTEEIRRGTKSTPAIQVGFEATYYEAQIPQAFYLADGLYHVISRTARLQVKNDTDVLPVSISTLQCQACLIRPSSSSTLTFNHGDLVLTPTWTFVKPDSSHSLHQSNSHLLWLQSLLPYLLPAPI